MPIEGKQLYIGGEPITLIQNNGFVMVDPTFVSEPPTQYQYVRYDPYSASLQLAIPGTDFDNPSGFTMSNWYDDISADIRGTGTSYTANPTGSVIEFTEYTADTKWADYNSSMKVQDNGSWGAITTADFSIGSQDFVLEGWLWMDERFKKAPYWKVGLRDSSYNLSLEMGFPAIGDEDWKSRIMINGEQYFSSNENIPFNLNQWYHIAFVRTSGNLYTYIDGTRYTNGTDSSSVTTGGTTRVMRGENVTNDGTDGAWQDFRFYVGTDKGYNGSTITVPPSMITTQEQDDDAGAFLAAANIQDDTQQNAINQLVLDLKSAGIWSKMKAIYPYVGGTADTHKWNLKDPRDSDAAYRLTFVGVNHSSDGITGQGGGVNNRGAFTHINISTDLSQNDVHFTTYINNNPTNVEPESHDMGAISGGNGMQLGSISPTTGNAFAKLMNNTNDEFANSDARGFYQISRTSSSGFAFQKDTTRQTNSLTSQAPPSGEYICITALGTSENTSTRQSIKRHAFSSVGSGLTNDEMDDLYTIVQQYQTTLGRNN